MTAPACPEGAPEICRTDARRARVRSSNALAGIDYVEVYPDGVTLCVHLFGASVESLTRDDLKVTGGARIRDIAVTSVKLHEHVDGDLCLLVGLDKTGDFSPYCVCIADRASRPGAGFDPRYACASFSFHIDCSATADCAPQPCALPPRAPPPAIDYLARDFDSFRSSMLDRLAQTLPEWTEGHLPDLGVTLVELFAYIADQLSYELDAVATEAFLRTARRRISVRRHARLVDYRMHEGCNARAWVTIDSDADVSLPLAKVQLAAMAGDRRARDGGLIDGPELRRTQGAVIFEPVRMNDAVETLDVVAAHSEIHFYTWAQKECCLPAGSTRATLLDGLPSEDSAYTLKLKEGDLLIFEETRGCANGSGTDADPARRHVVRLTRATRGVDPLDKTPIWEIEWDRNDALPFDLQLEVRTGPPDCKHVRAAVARGNVLLVDHGATLDEEDEWTVGIESEETCCVCDGASLERRQVPGRLAISLSHGPITHAEPPPPGPSAAAWMQRDPRSAIPVVSLFEGASRDRDSSECDAPSAEHHRWDTVPDLLSSGARDRHFVVEIDDDEIAHLRFGDDLNGRAPEAGSRLRARCRVGNGPTANVGRDAIVWIALDGISLQGVRLAPRNPLPATGGVAPESTEDVRLRAPRAFGRVLERAVAADDYAQLADENPRVQSAFAELTWTGSWYEASVALDTFARYATEDVASQVRTRLEAARRIGHDLRMLVARRVPLDLELSVCVEPHALRGDVERAVREVLSSRVLPSGELGLFHADRLVFGADVASSPIIAAVQSLAGVAHVEVTRFARLYASEAEAARSLADNLITLQADELAILNSDRNFPEQGRFELRLRGGR